MPTIYCTYKVLACLCTYSSKRNWGILVELFTKFARFSQCILVSDQSYGSSLIVCHKLHEICFFFLFYVVWVLTQISHNFMAPFWRFKKKVWAPFLEFNIVFSVLFLPKSDEYNLNPGLEWEDEFTGRCFKSLSALYECVCFMFFMSISIEFTLLLLLLLLREALCPRRRPLRL